LDAFKGSVLAKLEGHVGLERKTVNDPHTIETTKGISGEEVSWTPDCKYVVSGSLDGRVFVWDIQNLPQLNEAERTAKIVPRMQPVSSLEGHPGPSRCVRFNPRYAMVCVAGTELVREMFCQLLR
jgi:COMPASS component SWD2